MARRKNKGKVEPQRREGRRGGAEPGRWGVGGEVGMTDFGFWILNFGWGDGASSSLSFQSISLRGRDESRAPVFIRVNPRSSAVEISFLDRDSRPFGFIRGLMVPEILDGTRPGIFFDRKSARFVPSWKNAKPWTDEVFEEGGGQATASSRACGMSRVARVRSWSRSSVRRATVCPS